MSKGYDAIIIGAGIIGAAIGYELSKRGQRTLNVDMLPASGYGSTSNSCAIIRVYYSTLDGCAMAYDGYRKQLAHLDALGIPYEHWTSGDILERFSFYDLTSYAPAKRLQDPDFGEPTGGEIEGAVYFPRGGYISDPQLATQNIQHAAQRVGADFLFNRRVVEVPTQGDRVQGVFLDDGSRIEAPVVVNVAGPHSYKINALVGADRDMQISTRALRQEVAHVPAPQGVDYANLACVTSDSDAAVYTRPELGNNILIGSEDPPCDGPATRIVGSTRTTTTANSRINGPCKPIASPSASRAWASPTSLRAASTSTT
jgi:sarcosine oxidase subunit beta